MLKRKATALTACLLIAVLALAACGDGNGNGSPAAAGGSTQEIRQLLADCNTRPALGTFDDNVRFDDVNLVDMRFELVSLVFRLTGHGRFATRATMYQHSLHNTFGDFADHPAAEFASGLPVMPDAMSFSQILGLAAHLHYDNGGFTLLDDLSGLHFERDGSLWTHESVIELVYLLNHFYSDTEFAAFFAENMDVYMTQSERSLRLAFRPLRFDWFEVRGVRRDNMRMVAAPSTLYSNAIHITDNGEHVVYIIISELRAGEAWDSFWPFMLGNLIMPVQERVADELLAHNPEFYTLISDLASEFGWATRDFALNSVAAALMTLYRIDTEPNIDITPELNTHSNMWLGMTPDGMEDVLRMVIAHECNC